MSEQIPDQQRGVPAAHSLTRAPTTRRVGTDTLLCPDLSDLANTLRDQGHAVHANCADAPRHENPRLIETAMHFIEQALGLSSVTKSSHAYIRLYHSTDLLFLEVTQLRPKTFNRASHNIDAQHIIDELSHWAVRNDHVLSIRRGPRGQLKVALMVTAGPRSSR